MTGLLKGILQPVLHFPFAGDKMHCSTGEEKHIHTLGAGAPERTGVNRHEELVKKISL